MAKLNGVSAETLDQVWLSVKQAAVAAERKQAAIKKAIEKYPLIFDTSNHRTRIVHEDYPALEEITQTALDAYIEAQAHKPNRGGRKPNPSGAVWKQPIPADRHDEFVALVTSNGFAAPYKPAARARKPKVAAATAVAPLTNTVETFDAELIEA